MIHSELQPTESPTGKPIYTLQISLQPKYSKYSRRVYSFMEMLGDVGGPK